MTAPISNGPTTHGYTTMRDATVSGPAPVCKPQRHLVGWVTWCQKEAAKAEDAAVTRANLREPQVSPHAASNDPHTKAPGAVAPGAPGEK